MPAFPGTTGQTLNFGQIESLWIANGGPAAWAPTMAGIALAESGGLTNNLNDTPSTGDYSVGLFQINYYGSLLAGRTKEYGSPATLAANVNAQVKAAISILGGGPGILRWIVEGAVRYLDIGFKPPERVTVASAEYRQQQDTVSRFLFEMVAFRPSAQVPSVPLTVTEMALVDAREQASQLIISEFGRAGRRPTAPGSSRLRHTRCRWHQRAHGDPSWCNQETASSCSTPIGLGCSH